jgi:uncharacterized protein (TIGR03382 family)
MFNLTALSLALSPLALATPDFQDEEAELPQFGDSLSLGFDGMPPELLRELPEEVVGGSKVAAGDWDDAVGVVMYGQYVGCTGTLIAPDVVLTAGHCVGDISHVIVGSKNWYGNGGEMIEVDRVYERSNSQSTYDIAVLVLEQKSSYAPRPIALDCVADEYLVDGANVAIVGFGMTDEEGEQSTSRLMEGYTTITDADCSRDYINGVYTGCNESVRPGGEIGAGGDGVDACFGDSGGPLYLLTEQGNYVAGVTSRAYAGVPWSYPCKYGGIWARPDAVINWIENKSGREMPRPVCNEAPAPTAEDIETSLNTMGSTVVFPNDPDLENVHFFEIVEQPEYGTAEVNDLGEVIYTPNEGFAGDDQFSVGVTDDGSKYEASGPISADVNIHVSVYGDGMDPNKPTILNGGCTCDGGGSIAAMWLFLPSLGLLGFRRRK